MKISICVSPDAPPHVFVPLRGDLRGILHKAAEFGYDAVELHVYDLAPPEVRQVQSLLATHGLGVSAVCNGWVYRGRTESFTSPEEGARVFALERLKREIDLAHGFETQAVVGLIKGNLSQDPALRVQQQTWASDLIRRADDYAGQKSVTLVWEPLNRYETNFINRVDEAVALFQRLGLKHSGIHLDTFHMNIEEPSLEVAVRMASPYLAYVHFPDSNRWYPGAGHLDLPSVIRALREVSYDGYLTMEMLPLPDPETAVRRALENTRRLLME